MPFQAASAWRKSHSVSRWQWFPMRLSKVAVHWQESIFLPRLVLSEQLPSRTAIRWSTSQSVDRLTRISRDTFKGCESLGHMDIPESEEFIGSHAFSGCYSLEQITLGESLTMISDATFQHCCSLTRIAIPASVGFIGAAAFQNCNSLENILIYGPLTCISRDTFKGCESLKRMVIPALVTVIGQGAFEECCSLERVIMPESLTVIGNKAFKHCSRLLEISIPRRVQTIEVDAFIGCVSLRSIYMHTSLGYDAEEAFDENAVASNNPIWGWQLWSKPDAFLGMEAEKNAIDIQILATVFASCLEFAERLWMKVSRMLCDWRAKKLHPFAVVFCWFSHIW